MPSVLGCLLVVAPASAFALYHGGAPGRSEYAPGRAEAVRVQATAEPTPAGSPSPAVGQPRGLLRRVEHAARLPRVLGFATGMTQKLTNLSARLAQHVANVERRIAALQAAGHSITVEKEFAAARDAVVSAQDDIALLVKELESLADNERPRVVVRTFRQQIVAIRAQVRLVHQAFRALRLAIVADVVVRPSPSPSPSGSPLPSLSPTPAP